MRCERTGNELFGPLEPILFAVAACLEVKHGPCHMRLQALDGKLALVDDLYLQSGNRRSRQRAALRRFRLRKAEPN